MEEFGGSLEAESAGSGREDETAAGPRPKKARRGGRAPQFWCLLAPSRGGVPLLGETRSAELTLGDPCLLYGPFPANAHPRG